MDAGEVMSRRDWEILNISTILDLKIDPLMFSDWEIRREAYRARGFTEKAIDDWDWRIRREAYRIFGWSEKALSDKYWEIRREAKAYFKLKAKCESDEGKLSAKREIELWMLEKL